MTTLTPEQIAGYAYGAGFRGDALVWATAIGMAESDGRTDVVNSIGCVGVWQINQPVHVKAHPTWTQAWLKNPANNAAAAWTLSNGGRNWRPWEVFTNGMASLKINRARLAAAKPANAPATGTPVSNGVDPAGLGDVLGELGKILGTGGLSLFTDPPDAVADVGKALKGIARAAVTAVIFMWGAAKWMADPHNWMRIVQVVGGGVAVIVGLKMLAGTGGVAGTAASGAVSVASKASKAVKAAGKGTT